MPIVQTITWNSEGKVTVLKLKILRQSSSFCVFFFVDLKSLRSLQIIAGLRDVKWGGRVVPREMAVTRVKPPWLWEVACRCSMQLGCIPPVSGDRQLPGGDSRSASFPVGDVHPSPIT